MASISETGHAKNVANLETLITSVIALGTGYNPSKETISLLSLQTLLTTSENALNAVNVAQATYSNAVATRESAFEPFSKLITRVNSSLKASGTTTQVYESAQTIIRKLQGRRASNKLSDEEKQTLQAEGKEVNQISAAQMSYDSRIENFDKLITLLASVPLYNPNEEDLKVATLTTLCNDLKTKNTDARTATIQLSNARIARDEIMYKSITGLYYIATDVKTYIKSVFGTTSPQYKQISSLKFTIKK